MSKAKISFEGIIISIQPRIRLIRSFDERSHNYLGYAVFINGIIGDTERDYSVGIGKATQQKHQFCVGDKVSGECLPVADERLEPVEFYKVSKLKKTSSTMHTSNSPPWETVPPSLETYRQRGHRRLAVQTYAKKCITCIWACKMPVEIIIDNWNPKNRKYRFETFCYGPLICELYKAGPIRKVEGRNKMYWEEEDWVDEQATEHREIDE
ncbi:MAG TPA: hypothetical protein VFC73_07200 [Syntrophomonadaceae bacterium]|nr:hypothetical protein [Syntrophomonadaceae bacterium]